MLTFYDAIAKADVPAVPAALRSTFYRLLIASKLVTIENRNLS